MKIRLLDGSGIIDLKFTFEDTDRHGNVRVYFRRKGMKKIRLREPIGSPSFMEEYKRAFAGEVEAASEVTKVVITWAAVGSLRYLTERYYEESDDFSILAERTKHVRRMILDEICLEPTSKDDPTPIGKMSFANMPPLAVRRIRDRKKDAPEAGNSRVKALRQVFKFGIATNICAHNPAREVPYIKTGSEGFHSWDASEVRQFEATHPVGTKPRLALSLLLYLGPRRSDVVEFGKQHIRLAKDMSEQLQSIHSGRWLKYTQQKNRKKKPVTLTVPILSQLEAILAKSPIGDLTWLVTAFGKGFTPAGFGNWFRDQCDKAGLYHCSAHGLRKAGATIAAENGATAHQLMAIFGWSTIKQAEIYTRAADQKRLAGNSMHLLGDSGIKPAKRRPQ